MSGQRLPEQKSNEVRRMVVGMLVAEEEAFRRLRGRSMTVPERERALHAIINAVREVAQARG